MCFIDRYNTKHKGIKIVHAAFANSQLRKPGWVCTRQMFASSTAVVHTPLSQVFNPITSMKRVICWIYGSETTFIFHFIPWQKTHQQIHEMRRWITLVQKHKTTQNHNMTFYTSNIKPPSKDTNNSQFESIRSCNFNESNSVWSDIKLIITKPSQCVIFHIKNDTYKDCQILLWGQTTFQRQFVSAQHISVQTISQLHD